MAFQFKQFKIEDNQSAMKVGTDAVLLGSWVNTKHKKSVLDIGTGSGLIALMLAQKSTARIDAIDIHQASINQAIENFRNSPWSSRLKAECISLQEYCKKTSAKYYLIVSNPPFFDQSLKSPSHKKSISKHNDSLKFHELANGIKHLLTLEGSATLILPSTEARLFIDEARIEGLFCNKKTEIIPVEGCESNRWIFEISFNRSKMTEYKLTIRDKNHHFTQEYKALTNAYYLNF